MHQVSSLWAVGAGADACKCYARWWRWWESRTTEAAFSWNMSAICQTPNSHKSLNQSLKKPKNTDAGLQLPALGHGVWNSSMQPAQQSSFFHLILWNSLGTRWRQGVCSHTLAMLIYFKIIIIQLTYVEYKWYILFEISWTIQKYIEKVKIMKRINRTLHENSQTQICVYLVIPFTSSSKTGPMNLRW